MKNNIIFLVLLLIIGCQNDEDIQNLIYQDSVVISDINKYQDDFLLFTPIFTKDTYLFNRQGLPLKKWSSQNNALIGYLNNSGELYRVYMVSNPPISFGGQTGGIEKFDVEGNIIWNWEYASDNYILHHDIAILDNGNILAAVWEKKEPSEAIANGRDPSLLWEGAVWIDKIIEIKPITNNQAEIVWEWTLWDHLVQDHDPTKSNFNDVSMHPELIDINYSTGQSNFSHINSLEYIAELDQIVISSRLFNEFWVIDHSTTTSEASTSTGGNSGKGGNLLYRWGNPEAYQSGSLSDLKLFGQHDVTYIRDKPNSGGSFLVFNNNPNPNQSSVVEINVPINGSGNYTLSPNIINAPLNYSWEYKSEIIYSPRTSGARRLNNGNTLITSNASKTILEITPNKEIVWQYNLELATDYYIENNAFKIIPYEKSILKSSGLQLEILTSEEFNSDL